MAWVEQVERRAQKAKHFYDAETGKYRAEFGIHDLHYHTGLAWADVDESLVDDNTPGLAKRCDKTRHILQVGQGGERRWYPRRNIPGEYIAITETQYWDESGGGRWRMLNLPPALWKGNKAEWTRADMTFAITNTWRRVKLEIKLLSFDAPARMRFATEFIGLTLDGWSVKSGDEIVGRVDPVTATDANDNPLPAVMTWDGEYIEWSVDTIGATYPITIDPTFTDGVGGDATTAFDTYVATGSSTDRSGAWELKAGCLTGSESALALFKFTLTSLEGATITDADLYLYDGTISTVAATYHVNRILSANSGWLESAIWDYADGSGNTDRWAGDTGNDGGADAGCSISGTDYSSTDLSTLALSSGSSGTERDFDLDNTEFANMVNANYGLVVYNPGTYERWYFCSSDNGTTGYRPKLVVTYTEAAAGNPYYAYAQQ